MAPVKKIAQAENVNVSMPGMKKMLSRRALAELRNPNIVDQNEDQPIVRGKRKAEHSPQNGLEKAKRSALGNLTNNVQQLTLQSEEETKKRIEKNQTINVKVLPSIQIKTNLKQDLIYDENEEILPTSAEQQQQQQQQQADAANVTQPAKRLTRATTSKLNVSTAVQRPKRAEPKKAPAAPIAQQLKAAPKKRISATVRRISNDFNKTEESLYVSALEDMPAESMRMPENFEAIRRRSAQILQKLEIQKTEELSTEVSNNNKEIVAVGALKYVEPPLPKYTLPSGVQDFDRLNWDDPFQVSEYAMEIFEYLKSREQDFKIDDYLKKQRTTITRRMRTVVVDWMAGIQENFELNHETLYLAVKLVDMFISATIDIKKEKLQLLAATALFIACKYDERLPPEIDDFVFVTDGLYSRLEIIRMEIKILHIIDFDLSAPLSYRFLRRYARCANVPITALTLARFILEYSLMDYSTVTFSESKKACAVLFMALRMVDSESTLPVWTPTLVFYSGYNLAEFAEYVAVLNAWLQLKAKPINNNNNIYKKYSHQIFHEVAKIPLLATAEIFKNDMDLDASMNNTTKNN